MVLASVGCCSDDDECDDADDEDAVDDDDVERRVGRENTCKRSQTRKSTVNFMLPKKKYYC